MEHKKKLDELHKESLEKIEDYINTKKDLTDEQKEKLNHSKKEWQEAWNRFQEMILYLEQLEI